MARLFVAVFPTGPAAGALEQFERPDLPGLRWSTLDNLHVTIRFLGNPPVPLDELVASLEALSSSEPTLARIGPATEKLGDDILCFPAAGLDALAHTTDLALESCGIGPRDHPFVGHLTLARLRRSGSSRALSEQIGRPFDASFEVHAVNLIDSRTDPEGAQYGTVAEVMLGTGEPPK